MFDDCKLLDTLLAGLKTNVADGVKDGFVECRRIAKAISQLQRQIAQARKVCEAAVLELCNDIGAIQRDCLHPVTTYHPDASGGNDSETLCDVCGATVPRSKT